MSRADSIGRSTGTLVDRSAALLREDRLARRRGWLQAVHPVVKLLGVFSLIGLVVTFETPGPPAAMIGLTVWLAILSRIPLRTHALKVAVPTLVAVVVVSPQLVLVAGPSLVGPLSTPGATYVVTFALRVGASVSLLGLLVSTTRLSGLTSALRTLRVPRTAVALLTISYRYLLVVFEELARLVDARRSRRIRPTSLREAWQEGGSLIGTFLLRALDRGERVGRSARARGGTAGRTYPQQRSIGLADAAFAFVVWTTLAAGVILI